MTTQRDGANAPAGEDQPATNPSDEQRRATGPEEKRSMPPARSWLWFALILLANFLLVRFLFPGPEAPVEVPYTFFKEEVRAGNVEAIYSQGDTVEGRFEKPVTHPPKGEGGSEPGSVTPRTSETFTTVLPSFVDPGLEELLIDNGVEISAEPIQEGGSWWSTLLFAFGPALLLIGGYIWLYRRAQQQGGGVGGALTSVGRSRARRYDQESEARVTFEDVAGIEEAEKELVEIVDFLKDPQKYTRLGGAAPKGVLLVGAPGTGKTLLARAVAGEAGAPFFSLSASEFVEAIVGIGASRVRDLFKQAKESQPAIIFIDELDAIGRARTSGTGPFSGGNDEREQTLNQILTEMDGFDTGEAVIVLAATNRAEILDRALLRPGRFDRRVTVPPPDQPGRRQILEVHTRSLPLADDVDLDGIAASTPGMVGADLANLANEAALLAARRQHERVQHADFTDALEKIVLGAPRSVVLSEDDRRRTAYHESGHALVGMLTAGAPPPRKVSIIPRGMALGVTLSAPDVEKSNYEESYLLSKIKVALGGRVAEEIVYGTITAGAESDIQQLTAIARQMVGRWGMSDEVGPVAVLPSESSGPLLPGASEVSEQTQRVLDEEVRRLVDTAHGEVTALLTEHRAKLDSLTDALLGAE